MDRAFRLSSIPPASAAHADHLSDQIRELNDRILRLLEPEWQPESAVPALDDQPLWIQMAMTEVPR